MAGGSDNMQDAAAKTSYTQRPQLQDVLQQTRSSAISDKPSGGGGVNNRDDVFKETGLSPPQSKTSARASSAVDKFNAVAKIYSVQSNQRHNKLPSARLNAKFLKAPVMLNKQSNDGFIDEPL